MTRGEPLSESETNVAWLARCQRAWHDMLELALQRGFYGSVTLEVHVQDGTVQSIQRRIERNEK